jgi:hypothetical protein
MRFPMTPIPRRADALKTRKDNMAQSCRHAQRQGLTSRKTNITEYLLLCHVCHV